MSNKTLITIVCITIIIAMSGSVVAYAQSDSYGYDIVNSTKDEIIENTVDKEKSYLYNIENVTEKVCVKEEFVQGVKVSTFNNITYDVYSSGEKYISNSVQTVEFDNSSYNGNTKTLLTEAKDNVDEYINEINKVVDVTNKYRSEAGLNNLKLDNNLSMAASVRALEMAYTNKLSHVRPDGAKCFRVLYDLGINYRYAGENIGDGFRQAESVCEAWKNSPSHYKNIVSYKYNKIGIGVAKGLDGRMYWVQIFSN